MPNFLRWILVGSLLLSVSAEATEPDFAIYFEECKAVFAPLYLTKSAAIKIDDGTPYIMQCIRHGEIFDCQMDFKDGSTGIKGNIQKYKIKIDSPPLLEFELIDGTENIIVDTSQNAAVISSLLLDVKFAGSKVCHGSYFTNFQLKNMK
ncbi:MAG: hypothetical protein Q8N30_04295 [Methylococcales bacterium]|nr:hypothetical protein [Methylococcales bacterium]